MASRKYITIPIHCFPNFLKPISSLPDAGVGCPAVTDSGSSPMPEWRSSPHLLLEDAPSNQPLSRSFTKTASSRTESYNKEEKQHSKSKAQTKGTRKKGYVNMAMMTRLDTPDQKEIERYIQDLGEITLDDQEDSSADEGNIFVIPLLSCIDQSEASILP